MTKRKFFKTIITIEILSEAPFPESMDTSDVIREANVGSYSMRQMPRQQKEINGVQAAQALLTQGSDPSFFQLTPKGNDLD
jgi:hypothetical protein